MMSPRLFIIVLLSVGLYVNVHSENTITSKKAETSPIYKVVSSWDKAFQAKVKFKSKVNLNRGWNLRFQYRGKLQSFKCWEGILLNIQIGRRLTVVQITNKTYNGILRQGSIFELECIAHYAREAVDPSPPSVSIFFQTALIYKTPSLLPSTSTANPTKSAFPTTTPNVIDLLTRFLANQRPPSQRNQPQQEGGSFFNRLDNQFSPVEIVPPDYILSRNRTLFPRNQTLSSNSKNQSSSSGNQIHSGKKKTPEESNIKKKLPGSTKQSEESDEEPSDPQDPPTISKLPDIHTVKTIASKYNYTQVIHKSLLFYEAQRSGKLPATKRLNWTESSGLKDRGTHGEDLTGGYYDAGDYVKFGFPMAFSMTMMAWGVIEYWDVYEATGELVYALDAIKWGTDYLMKAHVSKYKLYGQVGNPLKEHKQWGRPDIIIPRRPAYSITKKKPGSELAAETSAALSAASIAFRRANNSGSTAYVEKLIRHATDLYEFAKNFRRKYHLSIKAVQNYYTSSGFKDEVVWAAGWLYRATGTKKYLETAEGLYQNWALFILPKNLRFSWDDKNVGVQMLLAQVSTSFKGRYEKIVTSYCNTLRSNKTFKTPRGLVYLADWSPLRYAANSAFVCLMAADHGLDSEENRKFSQSQIDYILGDGGRSYVIGFGKNYPTRPHHRSSTCPPRPQYCGWSNFRSEQANPIVLEGAVVGGPDKKDIYKDDRKEFKQTEVALDHNAGFQGAVAALQYHVMLRKKNITRSHEPWYKTYLEDVKKEKKAMKLDPGGTGNVPVFSYLTYFFSSIVTMTLLGNY